MTDKPTPGPTAPALSTQGETARQTRLEREAQALRANLRRRKDQARGRQEAGSAPDAAHPESTQAGAS